MRRIISFPMLFIAILAMYSCTDFQEEDVPVSFGVDVNVLDFATAPSTRSITVRSGVKWDVTSMPEWISLEKISRSGGTPYEWVVNFTATTNEGYNRDGIIVFKSNSETVSIVVTQEGKKGEYVPVESVSLSNITLEMKLGSVVTLTATILPSNASEKSIEWTSDDPDVASVSGSGTVQALSLGTTTITVVTVDGSKTAICVVKVLPIEVESISLNKNSAEIIVGDAEQLIATVKPDNATDKAVTWSSSNTSVAKVSSDGTVTAETVGSATITAKAGSKTATCTIRVLPRAVTSVQLNKTEITLSKGSSEKLIATVKPDNATDKSVTWSSSNTSVAKVSSDGTVTAVNKGSSIITVTTKDGGFKAECAVNVTIPVVAVSVEPKSLSLSYGQQATLVATISPSDASNQSVVWSSSNSSVATVSSSGVVYAAGGGSATITVRTVDGGYEAKCNVSVVVNVSGVTLNKTSLDMTQYDTETLIATIVPSNATNKNVVWSSDHPTVASVTSNGVVSAIGAGSAIITVTTEDSGYKATCNVTVTADPYEAVDLGLSVKWASMNYGASRENEVGGYYMWGDPIGNAVSMEYSAPNVSSISGTQYDIVRCNWGGKWRIPTTTEIRELYNNCSWAWTTSGGVSGVRVTGQNGNSIFIPVSGYALPASGPIGTTQTTDTTSGYMMSGNSYLDSSGYGRFAYVYYFSTQTFYNSVSFNANFVKIPIRPVR